MDRNDYRYIADVYDIQSCIYVNVTLYCLISVHTILSGLVVGDRGSSHVQCDAGSNDRLRAMDTKAHGGADMGAISGYNQIKQGILATQ